MNLETENDFEESTIDEINSQETKTEKDSEDAKEDKSVEDLSENMPENEDVFDEKLLYIEDRMYFIENKIETSYEETALFNTEIDNKLSRFENSEQSQNQKFLNEKFGDIYSNFKSRTRQSDDFLGKIMNIKKEYDKLKTDEKVSKEKKLEISWRMFVDLKKRYDEYHDEIKSIQSSLKDKLQEHSYLINGRMGRSEQDQKKLDTLQAYSSDFNRMKNNLEEIFSRQRTKMNRVSDEIHDEIMKTRNIFNKITVKDQKLSEEIENGDL